jgi:hypothetical protein
VNMGQASGAGKSKEEDEKKKNKDDEKDSIYATFKVGVPYTGKQVLYVMGRKN